MRELDLNELSQVSGAITWDGRTCVGVSILVGVAAGGILGGLAGGAAGGFIGGWIGDNVCPV